MSPRHTSISTNSSPSSGASARDVYQASPLTKSSRVAGHPSWLKDSVCMPQLAKHSTVQPPIYLPSSPSLALMLKPNLSIPTLTHSDLAHGSSDYVMSLVTVLQKPEPSTYAQRQQYPESVKAMERELLALEQNGTWVLTSLPHWRKALTSKWVHKTKFRSNGSVERHKARFVIRGFEQVKDKDYKHTFSPVAKLTTVRIFIALAIAKSWPLHQLDINNAFLHDFIMKRFICSLQ